VVDPEKIRARIEAMREVLTVLRRHRKSNLKQFLANRDAQFTVQHALYIAVQSLLDIGIHILADSGVRNISDYRDVIMKLGQIKVLPPSFTESIADMAGFRNRLIHEYEDIDPSKIHAFLKNRLWDFEDFIKYVRDYLRPG